MIQTHQQHVETAAAEKNAALLATVAPSATKQIAELEAQAAAITAEVEEFSREQLTAIRTIESHLSRRNAIGREIEKLSRLLGIVEAREANLCQMLSYVLQAERDPYSRKNAELLKNYISEADMLAPILPRELELRKSELGVIGGEINRLSKDHEIDLPALLEAFQRGPQPIEPTVEWESK